LIFGGHYISAFEDYNKRRISLPILYFEFKIGDGSNIVFEKKRVGEGWGSVWEGWGSDHGNLFNINKLT